MEGLAGGLSRRVEQEVLLAGGLTTVMSSPSLTPILVIRVEQED